METVELFKEYLRHLFAGKRTQARELLQGAYDRGFPATGLISNIIWPAMEQIDQLFRDERISIVTEHIATRINRMIADQMYPVMNRKPKDGRRVVILCGESQSAELGGQMAADIFEAEGWSVWFVGSGVPNDELVKYCEDLRPDLLLIHDSLPPEVPQVRHLIALFRELGVCEDMQVMLSGGIYNRAEDLAEEIKADLKAANVREAVTLAEENPNRVNRDDKPEPGRRRKRKRKTSPPGAEKLRRDLGLKEQAQAANEAVEQTTTEELTEAGTSA